VAVNEATGNVVVSLPTPSYPTATGSLGFSLTYNSQQTGAVSGELGVGWLLSVGNADPPSHVHDHGTDSSPAPSAEVDWPDGSADFYQHVGSSTSYAPV
jgi:hypothetical protein